MSAGETAPIGRRHPLAHYMRFFLMACVLFAAFFEVFSSLDELATIGWSSGLGVVATIFAKKFALLS